MSKPSDPAPRDDAETPISEPPTPPPAPPKIPSHRVLSVGTPSRPPGSSPALSSPRAVPAPPARSSAASAPEIEAITPELVVPPVSSPRLESTPPASRKLVPPPKPRRDSVPAGPDAPARKSSDKPAAEAMAPPPVAMPKSPLLPGSVPPRPVPAPPRPVLSPSPAAVAASAAGAPAVKRPSPRPPAPAATPPAVKSPSPPPPPPPSAAGAPVVKPPPPPPVPAALGIESGGAARVKPPNRTTRPPPRRSEPPAPAHVIVPTDFAAPPSKPTPAPAIQVMRIIAIGTPGAGPAPGARGSESREEVESELDNDDPTPALAGVETGAREPLSSSEESTEAPVAHDATELDDADLAPDSDSEDRPTLEKITELGRDDALSVPEFPATEATSVPESRTDKTPGAPTPPPPPRRPQPPRRPDTDRPRARRTLKRPWWEDIFGEDFSRAIPRLTDKQIAREVDFIEESLGVAKGGVVLDLACGSGHHAVELASRGYGVVGYDLSVYQLALAGDMAQERAQKINFLQGDMREMAFEAMFDGIYCWNTSFGYFEEEKNLAVAERIFRALKPGGMFLVDVANRDFAAGYSPSQLWYEGDSCVCMDDMSLDFITSRLRVKRSVIFDDGRSRECTYSVRLYSLHELGKLLHDVGFRVTEASGQPSMPGVFFGELSPRLIVLAQKP